MNATSGSLHSVSFATPTSRVGHGVRRARRLEPRAIEDGVDQKAWFCGNPDDFIAFLREIEDKYPGLEDIVLQWPEGMPWSEFREQLSIFAADVMPAFAGARSRPYGRRRLGSGMAALERVAWRTLSTLLSPRGEHSP